jgi:hypothetical protein
MNQLSRSAERLRWDDKPNNGIFYLIYPPLHSFFWLVVLPSLVAAAVCSLFAYSLCVCAFFRVC